MKDGLGAMKHRIGYNHRKKQENQEQNQQAGERKETTA